MSAKDEILNKEKPTEIKQEIKPLSTLTARQREDKELQEKTGWDGEETEYYKSLNKGANTNTDMYKLSNPSPVKSPQDQKKFDREKKWSAIFSAIGDIGALVGDGVAAGKGGLVPVRKGSMSEANYNRYEGIRKEHEEKLKRYNELMYDARQKDLNQNITNRSLAFNLLMNAKLGKKTDDRYADEKKVATERYNEESGRWNRKFDRDGKEKQQELGLYREKINATNAARDAKTEKDVVSIKTGKSVFEIPRKFSDQFFEHVYAEAIKKKLVKSQMGTDKKDRISAVQSLANQNPDEVARIIAESGYATSGNYKAQSEKPVATPYFSSQGGFNTGAFESDDDPFSNYSI